MIFFNNRPNGFISPILVDYLDHLVIITFINNLFNCNIPFILIQSKIMTLFFFFQKNKLTTSKLHSINKIYKHLSSKIKDF